MRQTKREEKIERVLQILEYLRNLGFEYILSHPDRKYRLVVWTTQCGRYMEAFCSGSWAAVENLIQAVLMGYEVGRCHREVETG
jgi:histidinol phosphatase-like enzyme